MLTWDDSERLEEDGRSLDEDDFFVLALAPSRSFEEDSERLDDGKGKGRSLDEEVFFPAAIALS